MVYENVLTKHYLSLWLWHEDETGLDEPSCTPMSVLKLVLGFQDPQAVTVSNILGYIPLGGYW